MNGRRAVDAQAAMPPDPVTLPITGELDLHTFRPRDVGSLVPEYLAECRARGLLTVRLVHGKGIGALRETVHALLKRNPAVRSFTLAGEQMGGWGATVVRLEPMPEPSPDGNPAPKPSAPNPDAAARP